MLSTIIKIIKPLVIVSIAFVIALGFIFNKPKPLQVAKTIMPPLVNVAEAVKQRVHISVRSQGTVTPRTETSLTAEVAGRITEVSEKFVVGGYINKGDILLRIDQRNYLANLKRSEASVASARSLLATERGRAEVAYQDWKKYNKSIKRSKNANDLALHKPQLDDAKAKLNASLADLNYARTQMDRTMIRAPYDGLIKAKRADIGQFVGVGTPLATTFAIATAEVRLSIPEGKLNYLNLPEIANAGQNSRPMVDLVAQLGGELHSWKGELVRTEGVFDERSRVLFAVVEIQDPYGLKKNTGEPLRIGTFVDARIEGKVIENLILLPRHILRTGNRIWVLDEQQRLQNRQVSILRTGGKYMYVTAGLAEGELISLSNISGTVAGKGVRIASTVRTDEQETTVPVEVPGFDTPAGYDITPKLVEPSSLPTNTGMATTAGSAT